MSYSGIILAGGKSSRMGQDKALMEFDRIPIIQHIATLLKDFTSEIIVASNNEDHHSYANFGVTDTYKNSGPMAGIEAGLNAASNKSCLVLSCDSPFITKSILVELTSEKDNEAIIATCNGRIHPLIGIYRKSSIQTIQSHLDQKQFKMRRLLEDLNTKYMRFPSSVESAFHNINTQEEWHQAIGK